MTKTSAAHSVAFTFILMTQFSVAQNVPLERLDGLLQDIRTLSASVTQLIVESDGGILEESEIRMLMKKPNGFYWETLTPFPELIVTNGNQLWNYQPDLEQVVIEDWDTSRSELAAQLLNGQTENLDEEYAIEQAPERTSDLVEFKLVPQAADSVYKEITITFINTELDMIYLHNKNGQQTVWRFADVLRNSPLADSQFEFDPPVGVEVIRNNYTN